MEPTSPQDLRKVQAVQSNKPAIRPLWHHPTVTKMPLIMTLSASGPFTDGSAHTTREL